MMNRLCVKEEVSDMRTLNSGASQAAILEETQSPAHHVWLTADLYSEEMLLTSALSNKHEDKFKFKS